MRPIVLLLTVAVFAGCGCGPAPDTDTDIATGPTAREQTARDRAARRDVLNHHTLLRIPRIGTLAWRYDRRERFVTVLEVPGGGATESVWMTVAGRLVKIGGVDPGDQAEAGPVAGGPVDVRVVQSTEPETVTARVRVVYNGVEPVPLVTARVRTRSHSRP